MKTLRWSVRLPTLPPVFKLYPLVEPVESFRHLKDGFFTV